MLLYFMQYKQPMKKNEGVLRAYYATISYELLTVVPMLVWEENKD